MTTTNPFVEIVSTGRFLPDRVVTNRDMESIVETSDAWIFERTGIRERRIALPEMTAANMGAAAARVAMERAGVAPEDVDILIISTATPDRLLPATACDVQALIGATKAKSRDRVLDRSRQAKIPGRQKLHIRNDSRFIPAKEGHLERTRTLPDGGHSAPAHPRC